MATEIWVIIGSCNGLLSDGTKPLPEPTLTSHYLNQLHIAEVLQHSPENNCTVNAQGTILYNEFKNYMFKIFTTSPRGWWLEGLLYDRNINGADSRFAPSQWETALLCNNVSHWLGANLESALHQWYISGTSLGNQLEMQTLKWTAKLTHWGHISICKLTIIGSDNGLSPGWRQAIIGTNAGILLIGPWGTNFSEMLIEIYIFSLMKMHLKLSSGNWRPFFLSLNELNPSPLARCGSSLLKLLHLNSWCCVSGIMHVHQWP